MLCSWQESWDWVWVALASEILHIQCNGWPSAVLLPPQHHKQGWCPGLAAQLRVGGTPAWHCGGWGAAGKGLMWAPVCWGRVLQPLTKNSNEWKK